MFRRAAAVALLLLPLVVADDQQVAKDKVRRLSFEEAVDLGLAFNLGLKSARISALMERLVAEAADAAWDTTLTATVGGGESLSPSRSTLAGADVVDVDNAFFNFGVTKPLRLGPTLGLEWRADRTFTNSSFSTINPAYDTALEVSLTVPLLRGRGREANESDLRASRASARGARFNLLDEASAMVQRVAEAYWELVYRQGRVTLLEKSVAVAREVEQTERRKLRPEIGRSTKLDVTKAAAETKRREVAVIQGRADVADASDDLRRLVLPFRGNAEDAIVFRATGVPGDQAKLPDLAKLVESALSRRPDIKKIETDLARRHEAVVQARDALRFQLDLRGSFTLRGVDGSFEDSAGSTLSGDTPSGEASITFVWPFGRRAARAQLRRAQLDVERERVTRDRKINEVVIEVRKAHRGLRTALEESAATRQELAAAREALAGERKRLERGSATVLEVSQLEENLTDAELRLLQSLTSLERARIAVRRASGTLIGHFKITLGPQLETRR